MMLYAPCSIWDLQQLPAVAHHRRGIGFRMEEPCAMLQIGVACSSRCHRTDPILSLWMPLSCTSCAMARPFSAQLLASAFGVLGMKVMSLHCLDSSDRYSALPGSS